VIPLWVDSGGGDQDNGLFAFARATEDGNSFAVVVINASDEPRVTGIKNHAMQLPPALKTAGKNLRPALTIGIGKSPEGLSFPAAGPLRLPVPASSLVVYEAVAE
jgi:hypothetical protein